MPGKGIPRRSQVSKISKKEAILKIILFFYTLFFKTLKRNYPLQLSCFFSLCSGDLAGYLQAHRDGHTAAQSKTEMKHVGKVTRPFIHVHGWF